MEGTIKFTCNYCGLECPHFKALLEHYKECHEDKLNRYEIKHYALKQVALIYATSEDEALQGLDWLKEDCKIRSI